MSEAGYYSSKKTDDICDDVCGQEARAAFSMSRIHCILRGLDVRAIILFFLLVPTIVCGIYLHGQKISYFLRPIWDSPPKPLHDMPHYYHENVSMANLCKLHGWGIREMKEVSQYYLHTSPTPVNTSTIRTNCVRRHFMVQILSSSPGAALCPNNGFPAKPFPPESRFPCFRKGCMNMPRMYHNSENP